MNIDDFILVKDNAFTDEFCDQLVNHFEESDTQGLTYEGYSGRGINHDTKHTTDLNILEVPELDSKYTKSIVDKFNDLLMNDYLNKLPHQDLFPGNSLFFDSTFYECLNIQRYKQGEGHYNAWHIETGNFQMSRRMFAFILYLTDVNEGGETELLYSKTKINSKKGRLLIFPSTFPYVHKGHMPIDNDKYILTTWLSFVPK